MEEETVGAADPIDPDRVWNEIAGVVNETKNVLERELRHSIQTGHTDRARLVGIAAATVFVLDEAAAAIYTLLRKLNPPLPPPVERIESPRRRRHRR